MQTQNENETLLCTFGDCKEIQTGDSEFCIKHEEEKEITDLDLEEIGRLIKGGATGGRLDCDNGKHITWNIDLSVWYDQVIARVGQV